MAAGEVSFDPSTATAFDPSTVTAEPEERSTLEKVGRQVGLTVRHGVEGALALPGMGADAVSHILNLGIEAYNKATGSNVRPQMMTRDMLDQGLSKLGLPTPENATERIVGDVTGSMAGAGGGVALGRGLANSAGPVARGVGETLSAAPGVQTASAVTGAAAAGATSEMGGGPGAQLAAGAVGAILPSASIAGGSSLARRTLRGGELGRMQMQERINTFRDADADPSMGQATGSRGVAAGESALAKTPGGAGVMAKAAEQQSADMGARVDEIANSVSPNPSAAKAGAQIEQGIKKFVGRFRAQQNALYTNLDKVMPADTKVPVLNFSQTLDEISQPITGAPSLSAGALGKPAVEQIKKQLSADMDNGALPYEAIKQLRTRIGEKLSNQSLVDDVDRATWKRLYGALSQDMSEAAKAAGPIAERAFARANDFTKAGHGRIETYLDRVSNKDTVEKIFLAAVNPSELKEGASTINAVMRSLEPQQRSAVSAAVVKRLGTATAGNQNDLGELFSSQTFLTNWNKISPDAKRVLFAGSKGNELRENLDTVAKAANMVKQGSKVFSNPSGTAQAMANIGGMTSVVTSSALGHPWVAGSLIAAMGVANMTAKAMTNPDFVRWAARTTTLSKAALPAQLNQLSRMAREQNDPEVKDELGRLLNEMQSTAADQ